MGSAGSEPNARVLWRRERLALEDERVRRGGAARGDQSVRRRGAARGDAVGGPGNRTARRVHPGREDAARSRREARGAPQDVARVPEQPGRDAARQEVAADPVRPGVVRHERELHVGEGLDEPPQVPDAGADVRHGVEGIGGREPREGELLAHCRDHELHEPHRARRRDGPEVVGGLRLDHREHEERRELGARRLLEDDAARSAAAARGRGCGRAGRARRTRASRRPTPAPRRRRVRRASGPAAPAA